MLLPDMVARAYGLLKYAYRLEYGEFINALGMIRLGVICGFIIPPEDKNEEDYLGDVAGYYLHGAPYHMEYHAQKNTVIPQEVERTLHSREIIRDTILSIELMRELLQITE